jgi:hypothetical protein
MKLTVVLAIVASILFAVACGGGKDADAPAVAVKAIAPTDTPEPTSIPNTVSSESPTPPPIPMVLETVSPELLSCVQTALGDEQYNAIISGRQDPVAEQLGLVLPCIMQYPQEANAIMEMFGLDMGTIMAASTPVPGTQPPSPTKTPAPQPTVAPTATPEPTPIPKPMIVLGDAYNQSDFTKGGDISINRLLNAVVGFIVEHGYGHPVGVGETVRTAVVPQLRIGNINAWVYGVVYEGDDTVGEQLNEAIGTGDVESLGKSIEDRWYSNFVVPTYVVEQNPGLQTVYDLPKYCWQPAKVGHFC